MTLDFTKEESLNIQDAIHSGAIERRMEPDYRVGDLFKLNPAREKGLNLYRKSQMRIKKVLDNGTVYAIDENAQVNKWADDTHGFFPPAMNALQESGDLIWLVKNGETV